MSSPLSLALMRHWRAACVAAAAAAVLHAGWAWRSGAAAAQETFDVEARIAHRLVSERLAALDTLLRALAAAGPPATGDTALPARLMALDPAVRGLGWLGPQGRAFAGETIAPSTGAGLQGQRLLLRLDGDVALQPYLSADVTALLPAGDRAQALQSVALQSEDGAHRATVMQATATPARGWPLQFAVRKPIAVGAMRLQFLASGQAVLPWTLWLPSLVAGAAGAALVLLGGALWQARRERLRAEGVAQLSQAGRLQALGELAAQVAHELNQPLAALVSQSQAARRLLADDGPTDAVTRALEANVAQAERATAIVARLRASVSGAPPVRLPVDLGERTRGMLFLLEPRLSAQRVQVTVQGLEGLKVLGDPVQVDQILHNLLSNALDALASASPHGPARIRLQARAQGGGVQLDVEDNGPGIAPAVATRLFDPFVSTRPEGTGLGLAIARTLAEHLGGELALDPHSEVGARFVLRLPQVN